MTKSAKPGDDVAYRHAPHSTLHQLAVKRRRKSLRADQSFYAAGVLAGQIVTSGVKAWLSLASAPRPNHQRGRVIEVHEFGSNPGNLRMFSYASSQAKAEGAPVIVVMHGCGQGAASFAADTGWVGIAEQIGAVLVLPEQKRDNNRGLCFNWFRLGDTRRGEGESLSVRQMIKAAVKVFCADPKRVFIVGLSAGGSMAAALLAAYPSVFTAGAIVAGMPVGVAFNGTMALLRMHQVNHIQGATALAEAVRTAAPRSKSRVWPRLSIWQGDDDRVVSPANAERLALQWCAVHGLAGTAPSDIIVLPGARQRVWRRRGRAIVELWTIADVGHGFPIDRRLSDGGRVGFGVVDAGLSAAAQIARFWDLCP